MPLDSLAPSRASNFLTPGDEDDLLPLSHLTPNNLLGGSTSERETVGQLYATQIASTITLKNPDEHRSIIIGLGLDRIETTREQFLDILELVSRCL